MSQAGVDAATTLSDRYSEVVQGLRPRDWSAPSRCAGWRVQDLVAHTGSNFRLLVEPPPAAGPVPGLTAERAQDRLVDERRGWSPEQVLEEFETYRQPALAVLSAVQAEPTASVPLTMNELGTYPMAALADAFAFDLYCHLRVDLLTPTGPVQHPLPEPADEDLRPGIGWMLTGLPQMCPAVQQALDAPIGLRLTGPGGGEWTLRRGSDRLSVVDGLVEPCAVATSPAHAFVLWGTGRSPWRDSVRLTGDEEQAAPVLDAVDVV